MMEGEGQGEDKEEERRILSQRLTRHGLYGGFLRKHYIRESQKLVQMEDIGLVEEKLKAAYENQLSTEEPIEYETTDHGVWALEDYTRWLVQEMFMHHKNSVRWHVAEKQVMLPQVQVSFGYGGVQKETMEKNTQWLAPFFWW